MQSVIWLVLCAVVAVMPIVVMICRSRLHLRRLRLRVQKFYASRLFDDMLPLVRLVQRYSVETVTVDKTGVTVRLLYPAGNETSFLMRANGYPYLTPERQEALRAVLEECVPKLADKTRYCLTRQRDKLVNGDVEYHYSYIISNAYKMRLARAPYYDGSLQARLW